MLNLNEIAARIERPELCVSQDIDSLRTLCETYPYSQVFPLLYLKTLAQTNDVRLDNELQKYAYRIADRTVLFDLLSGGKTADAITTQDAIVSEVAIVEETSAIETEEARLPVVEVVSEEIIVSTPEITEESESVVPVVEEKVIDVVADEIVPLVEDSTLDLPTLPDEVLQELSLPTEIYSLEAEEAKIAQQKEETAETEERNLEEEKQKLIAALTPSKPLIAVKEEPKLEPQTNRSFTSWLRSNDTPVHESREEKQDSSALIDHFISSEPKISTPKEKLFEDRTDKNELYNPTRKAKESLDESQLPVSETLAKIFAAQGNYPKAIFAYKQLMLIFPEKKVFFATQIEELNKKLNI